MLFLVEIEAALEEIRRRSRRILGNALCEKRLFSLNDLSDELQLASRQFLGTIHRWGLPSGTLLKA